MKTLLLGLLLTSQFAFAVEYKCKFDQDKSGDLSIQTNGSNAKVELSLSKSYVYSNCKSTKDDFGVLIDCNSPGLDFMVLINNEVRPASGGIMSTTHDLFVDIDC